MQVSHRLVGVGGLDLGTGLVLEGVMEMHDVIVGDFHDGSRLEKPPIVAMRARKIDCIRSGPKAGRRTRLASAVLST
jgi:hypothetical protein